MNPYPWQQQTWQRLYSSWQQGRLPHALLLTGPAGLGKHHLAQVIAQALLCQSPDGAGLSCGHCSRCRLLQANSHPDLQCIEPEERGKAILVDQIREFIQSAGLSSQMGGIKVVIIEPADSLNVAASNALLKTLEEPIGDCLFILITDRPSALSATIRSRCQLLPQLVPETQLALQWLQTQSEAADWPNLLAMAAGAPLRALQLSQEDSQAQQQRFLQDVQTLFAGKADVLALAERWSKEETARILEWLLNVMVDILRLSANTAQQTLLYPQLRTQLAQVTTLAPQWAWHRLAQAVIQAKMAQSKQLNMQLQLEHLLLEISDRCNGRGGR